MLCTTAINTSNTIRTQTGAGRTPLTPVVGILIRAIMCLLQCSDRVEPPEVKVAMTSRGRRVKQSRPTRCVARDADAQFRGAICRFAMTFDGRRAQLNIAADFRPVDRLLYFTDAARAY